MRFLRECFQRDIESYSEQSGMTYLRAVLIGYSGISECKINPADSNNWLNKRGSKGLESAKKENANGEIKRKDRPS